MMGMQKWYKSVKINGRWQYEHRYLAEIKIGRKLIKGEVVHHVNGDRLDNRIGNLQVMTIGEHMRHHNTGRTFKKPEAELTKVACVICGELFKPYRRRGKRSKTCSIACSNKSRAYLIKGECAICGKTVRQPGARTCSIHCRNKLIHMEHPQSRQRDELGQYAQA